MCDFIGMGLGNKTTSIEKLPGDKPKFRGWFTPMEHMKIEYVYRKAKKQVKNLSRDNVKSKILEDRYIKAGLKSPNTLEKEKDAEIQAAISNELREGADRYTESQLAEIRQNLINAL
jgi:hypothetical protein